VRPCTRISSDDFVLHETVAEYIQMMTVKANVLDKLIWDWFQSPPANVKPEGMGDNQDLQLFGGGTLIFDEFSLHLVRTAAKP
jgi:hypothetical protein